MGFTETFGTLGRLIAAYRTLVRTLDEARPDLVVLIDYPEFNLRLAKQAKRRGIPVFYFVAPQVWAWRKGRIRTIAERVDRLAAVFPFEPDVYNRDGRPLAEFVGHPLLDVVAGDPQSRGDPGPLRPRRRPAAARAPAGQPQEGGRPASSAPCAKRRARLAPDGWQTIAGARRVARRRPTCRPRWKAAAVPVPVAHDDTYNVVAAADAALVASGTATLETALLGLPDGDRVSSGPTDLLDRPPPGRRPLHRHAQHHPPRAKCFPELIQDAVTPAADGRRRARCARAAAPRSAPPSPSCASPARCPRRRIARRRPGTDAGFRSCAARLMDRASSAACSAICGRTSGRTSPAPWSA